jgi:predicted transcriptional regulator
MNYIQTPVSLLLDKSLNPTDKVVLQYLLWRQGDNQNCWPSIRTISKDLGLCRDTVQKSLERLSKTGFVSIDTPEKRGRGHRNSYIVNGLNFRTIKGVNGLKNRTIKWPEKQDTNGLKNRTELTPLTNTNKTLRPKFDEFRLAELLLNLILERKPDFKKPNLQQWAKSIDCMIRLDRRAPERIEAVIRWCQRDSFWQGNILSTAKLREKFDQLEMKMKPSVAQQPTTAPLVRGKDGLTPRQRFAKKTDVQI